MSWPYFWHVTAAVNFLILLSVLVIEIGFQCQLGTANKTLKASAVKESKILQWSHTIYLIDRLIAPETSAFVKIGSIHLSQKPRGTCPSKRKQVLQRPDCEDFDLGAKTKSHTLSLFPFFRRAIDH